MGGLKLKLFSYPIVPVEHKRQCWPQFHRHCWCLQQEGHAGSASAYSDSSRLGIKEAGFSPNWATKFVIWLVWLASATPTIVAALQRHDKLDVWMERYGPAQLHPRQKNKRSFVLSYNRTFFSNFCPKRATQVKRITYWVDLQWDTQANESTAPGRKGQGEARGHGKLFVVTLSITVR